MKYLNYYLILMLLLVSGCRDKKNDEVVITSIAIEVRDNISFYQGDSLVDHLNSFFVVVNYSNSKKEVVKLSEEIVTIFDAKNEKEGLIEIKLHGKKVQKTFKISENKLVDFDIQLVDGRHICLGDNREIHLDSFVAIGSYINGDKRKLKVEAKNIKEFDTSNSGKKNIVFIFESIEKTIEVEIEENRIVDYELKLKSGIDIVEGDSLTKHIGALVANEIYLNGTKKEIQLEEKNILSFDTQVLGKKYIVLYIGYRAKARLEIEVVKNRVVDYEVTVKEGSVFWQYEDKSKHLNSFDILGSFLNGDKKTLELKAEDIITFNTEKVGLSKVEFQFDSIKRFAEIGVERNEIIDFNISAKANISFVQGDSLAKHIDSFEVSARFSNGSEGSIDLKEGNIKGFDTTTIGIKKLIFTLEGIEKTLDIEVIENQFAHYEIKVREGRSFVEGDQISKHLDSFEVHKVYINGTRKRLNIRAEDIKSFDTSSIGIKTLTFTFESIEKQFEIEVEKNRVVDLDIKVKDGVNFVKDDRISDHLTSFEIKEIYLNGEVKVVDMDYKYIKYFSTFWLGKNTIKFKFGEGGIGIKEFEIDVVANRVVRLDLSLRDGVEVFVGDKLNQHFDSIIVKEIYLNGDEELKTIEKEDVVNFDTNKVGKVEVTITIEGVSTSIDIDVVEKKVNEVRDFTYTTTNDGIIITDYIGTSKQVTIPSEIEGQTVVELGEKSFYKKGLITIDMPDTIKKVGVSAFFANNLATLYIPDSVVDIEESAFGWNKDLREVRLPRKLKVIKASTFYNCAIRNLTIPDSVQAILDNAFKKNEIVDLKLSKNLKYIWHEAFMDNNILRVEIPEGMTHVGWSTFRLNNIKELILPKSLIYIGQYAFANNDLVELVLPQGLEELESFSFTSNKLVKVNIPPKINTLKNCVFSTNRLKNVVIPDTVTELLYGTLKGNELEEIVIPNSVKKIGRDNFTFNSELKKVTMPKILEGEIGKNFFASQLEQIEFIFTE